MKYLIAVAVVFLLSIPSTFAQEPMMPQPTFATGDTWTYKIQLGRNAATATYTVLGVTSNGYAIREQSPDGTKTLSVPKNGNLTPEGAQMQWPLSLGKTWSDNGTEQGMSIFVTATVEAYELVTVPAGSFKAFRVKVHLCTVKPPQGDCGDSFSWMAPEAKTFVKIEIGKERVWDQLRGSSMALMTYSVTNQVSLVPCGAAHVDPGWCRPDGTRLTPMEACVELHHTTLSWCREDGTFLGKP